MDHVDARIERGFDIFIDNTRQPTDVGRGSVRDIANGFELGVGVDREPCLDDVGTHLVEQRRYLPFVFVGERRSWRLLAVTQRGVENSCVLNFGRTIQSALEELDPPGFPTNPPCWT
jgi:hypothetical protein